jgi:hypothetical protein
MNASSAKRENIPRCRVCCGDIDTDRQRGRLAESARFELPSICCYFPTSDVHWKHHNNKNLERLRGMVQLGSCVVHNYIMIFWFWNLCWYTDHIINSWSYSPFLGGIVRHRPEFWSLGHAEWRSTHWCRVRHLLVVIQLLIVVRRKPLFGTLKAETQSSDTFQLIL